MKPADDQDSSMDRASTIRSRHKQANNAFVPAAGCHFLTPLYDVGCVLFGLGRRFQRGVVERLALKGNERVLDVGCGTGMFLDELTRRHPKIHASGVDADAKILPIASRRLNSQQNRADLRCERAEALPYAEASFDVVVSTLVFHHLSTSTKHAALREIHRVLRPGGRLLLVDFGARRNGAVPRWQRLFEHVEHLEDHVRGRLPDFIAEAGFANVRCIQRRWPAVEYWIAVKGPISSSMEGS